MRICVVGSGYVGLVSGVCLADFGHEVVCVDNDPLKVRRLRAGDIPIFEPGLEALLEHNVRAQRLSFSESLKDAAARAEVIFIAVGTPSRRGDGHADLTYVYAVAHELAEILDHPAVVVTKSTVPVGTGDEIERIFRTRRPDLDVAVVSNPEFLREGAAIADFKHPDRVVIGGAASAHARAAMSEVYQPLSLNQTPILFTERRTAELIKYAANAFLALKITYINEIADLCEAVGADVLDVSQGIGLDARIGRKFLNAGPGYGGSCFPKDTLALARTAREAQAPLRLVETTVEINALRKKTMAMRILRQFPDGVEGKTIAILGLTFKPDTDDMRDAPALDIIPELAAEGALVRAYDPEGMHEAARRLDIAFAPSAYACAAGAHAIVVLTEWDEFRALDLHRLRADAAGDLLFDLRNIYACEDAAAAGFRYCGIGRAILPTPEAARAIAAA